MHPEFKAILPPAGVGLKPSAGRAGNVDWPEAAKPDAMMVLGPRHGKPMTKALDEVMGGSIPFGWSYLNHRRIQRSKFYGMLKGA